MKAVNLIPRDDRDGRVRTSAGIGVHMLLGGLGLVLVLVVVYVLSANSAQDRSETLASVKAETALAQAEAARLKPYGDFAELRKTRVEAVRSIAASRFDWARALRGVSVAIPRGVDLTGLEATRVVGAAAPVAPPAPADGDDGEAPAAAAVAAAPVTTPTIKLDGCTSGQRQVAGMMAAMRQVAGVQEVDLASSNAKSESKDCDNAFSVSIGFTPPPPSIVPAAGTTPAAAVAPSTDSSKGGKK